MEVDLLEDEPRVIRLALRVPAPARMSVPQVLATTILRDELRALLLRRAVGVIDAERSLLAILDEGDLVELVDQVLRHRLGQDGVRLLEGAPHDLNLQALCVVGRVPGEEGANISLELLIRVLRPHEAHPQDGGRRSAHQAWAVRRELQRGLLLLGAPSASAQDLPQLMARTGVVPVPTSLEVPELHQVTRKDLRGLRDDVVLVLWDPDVVPVRVALGRRLQAEAQRAHKHVLAATAIAHAHAGVLGEVLAAAEHLPSAEVRAEALLHNGQKVLLARPMEALQEVRAAKHPLDLCLALAELVRQQRVVDGPSLQDLARAAALLPQLLQVGEAAPAGTLDGHTLCRGPGRRGC
mmetsp:Transcript_48690/g.110247  ORF Transcript_48690/g.110247 Transcript_48690/m.110247 type:complete len:352 (+) Transcript_48690:1010-2065(+)